MNALDKLYARIPAVVGCKIGCSDCCGPVPMTGEEAGRIKSIMRPEPFDGADFITSTKPGCMTCAYSTPKGCSIYADRPLICRIFATAPDEPKLRCPHGAQPVRPLTPAQAHAISEEYLRMMK